MGAAVPPVELRRPPRRSGRAPGARADDPGDRKDRRGASGGAPRPEEDPGPTLRLAGTRARVGDRAELRNRSCDLKEVAIASRVEAIGGGHWRPSPREAIAIRLEAFERVAKCCGKGGAVIRLRE